MKTSINKIIHILTFNFLLLLLFDEIQADDWRRVYLATYPRSGNHWIRYLVEEASGIATGSVYCDADPQHLRQPFPWGGFSVQSGYTGHSCFPRNSDIMLIKTHFPAHNASIFDGKPYVHTIRIVRHPIDSLYSQYLYVHHNKPAQRYISREEVKRNIAGFKAFQEHWDNQPNVTTIRYEDLFFKPYLFIALDKILKILGYNVKREDIVRAISKYPPVGKPLKHLKNWKREDLELVSSELEDFMKRYKYAPLR